MKAVIAKQFSVFMPNKPGSLARMAKLFSDHGVNIVGIASEVRDDSGVVRLTVDAERDVSHLLTQSGFTCVETAVLSVEVPNKPGALHQLAAALATGKINITTVYGTVLDGGIARIIFAVENPKKAVALLEKIRFAD